MVSDATRPVASLRHTILDDLEWGWNLLIKSPRVTGGLIVSTPISQIVEHTEINEHLEEIAENLIVEHLFYTISIATNNRIPGIYGCGKNVWHPSRWPWLKVTKLPKRDRIWIVPKIKWEPLTNRYKKLVGIFPLSYFPPD